MPDWREPPWGRSPDERDDWVPYSPPPAGGYRPPPAFPAGGGEASYQPPIPAFGTGATPEPDEPLAGKGVLGQYHLASWWWRVAAGLIDFGATIWLPVAVLDAAASVFGRSPHGGWELLIVVVLVVANSAVLQGVTGQSLGKVIFGLQLCRPVLDRDRQVPILALPGVVRCLWRLVLHVLLDFPLFPFSIGFCRPLWAAKRQTFADRWVKTVVLAPRQDVTLIYGHGEPLV